MPITDYRLSIDSVRGELKRGGKEGEKIEILSFEFGADAPHDAATGHATGRRRYSDVTFRKLLDKSSPALQTMLANHTQIRKATLTCFRAGDHGVAQEYYKVEWTDAYISAYRLKGNDLRDEFGSIPREEFTMNFGRIEVTYSAQENQGGTGGGIVFSDDLRARV